MCNICFPQMGEQRKMVWNVPRGNKSVSREYTKPQQLHLFSLNQSSAPHDVINGRCSTRVNKEKAIHFITRQSQPCNTS